MNQKTLKGLRGPPTPASRTPRTGSVTSPSLGLRLSVLATAVLLGFCFASKPATANSSLPLPGVDEFVTMVEGRLAESWEAYQGLLVAAGVSSMAVSAIIRD